MHALNNNYKDLKNSAQSRVDLSLSSDTPVEGRMSTVVGPSDTSTSLCQEQAPRLLTRTICHSSAIPLINLFYLIDLRFLSKIVASQPFMRPLQN
jgi:hypothetical protein